MKVFKILPALLVLCAAFPAFSATDKEMEEARTYTAQAYLRYANNGSDYLDNISVKTLSELKGKLKAKELENIKSFEAVAVPKDYASWDKAKLTEYWSKTFFASKGLIAEGCHGGAKARVKRKIEAMTVTANASAQPKEETASKADENSADPLDGLEADPNAAAAALTDAAALPDSLEATQKRLEEAMEEEAASHEKGNSYTWVYIGILIALVAVVIWLVIFASKVMKRNEEEQREYAPLSGGEDSTASARLNEAREENNSLRERFSATIAGKDRELSEARQAAEILRRENTDLRRENEAHKAEVHRLREDLARIGAEYKAHREATSRPAAPAEPASQPYQPAAPAQAASTPTQAAPVASPLPGTSSVAPHPVPASAPQPAPQMPRTIFLGRANSRGLFVRADRKLNIGHTLFRLDTTDGFAGTFRVAADPTVWEMALLTPVESLSGACVAPDLEMTAGMNRIVTESPGTAIFEDGCWKVIRKAKIRYEA